LEGLTTKVSVEIKIEEEAQYKTLQPKWFDYAPLSMKQKRKELKNTDNVEKLQWIHDNVSYNADSTINILKLNKTFCEDISWQNKHFKFKQAQELERNNIWWYKLMTDYHPTDSDQEKIQTDWYKVINVFSDGQWDTVEGMQFFRDMSWCNGRYWTATTYKNDKWKKLKSVARFRTLYKHGCGAGWDGTDYDYRVCGLKDAM
jgi:hypothetical protein